MMKQAIRYFTIIELMIACVILGVMAGLVTTNLDNFIPGARTESSVRQLGATINMLYEKSISSGRLYGLRYNVTGQYYEIRLLFLEGEDSIDSQLADSGETAGRIYFPEGVKLAEINDDFGQSVPRDNEQMEVRFEPAGYVTPHRVHLVDANEDEWTLEVLFLTGQVIYHRGWYEPDVTLERALY